MTGFEMSTQAPFLFWFVAGLAVLSVAISKSGFGGALGSMSIPILLFVLPPKLAIGVLLPLFLVTDVWVVHLWRKFLDRRILLYMCGFGLAGQAIGWLIFDYFSDQLLSAIIGLIATITAINYFYKQWINARDAALAKRAGATFDDAAEATAIGQRMLARIKGRAALWCGLSGISSFVSLSGGIPAQIFLLPHGLARQAFVGTMSVYFFVINIAKLPFYSDLGLFTAQSLTVSAWLLPIIPAGVIIGKWLNQKMSDRLFYQFSHAILLVMGVKLMVGG